MSHRPRKRFGQNFLHDSAIIQQIILCLAPRPGQTLVEIGPGKGALTFPVLHRLDSLHVIEIDRDLAAMLANRPGDDRRLIIHNLDVLKLRLADLKLGHSLRIFGNLPYNISSPLLFHLFDQIAFIEDMHFMLQQEVVARLAANPGSKAYGRVSILAQYYCQVERLFGVPAESFRPAPRVESAVVRLQGRKQAPYPTGPWPVFDAILRAAFANRRKTLANNLKSLADRSLLEAAGVDPGARAETIAGDRFGRIAELLAGGQDAQLHRPPLADRK